MIEEEEDDKPWLEKRFGRWEVNTKMTGLVVCCGANETIEIDKLYGPLCATGVRVRLEYEGEKSDWVIERERLNTDEEGNSLDTTWIEMARWDCQMDWPEDR